MSVRGGVLHRARLWKPLDFDHDPELAETAHHHHDQRCRYDGRDWPVAVRDQGSSEDTRRAEGLASVPYDPSRAVAAQGVVCAFDVLPEPPAPVGDTPERIGLTRTLAIAAGGDIPGDHLGSPARDACRGGQ